MTTLATEPTQAPGATPPPRVELRHEATPVTSARRLLGCLLIVLSTLPVYRLLVGRETGIAGEVVTMVADVYLSLLVSGALLAVPVALLGGWLLSPEWIERIARRIRSALLAVPTAAFAMIAAGAALLLSSAFTLLVLEGKPSIIDAIVQLLHARYWAEGRLAGPAGFMNEFWHIQNSLITPRGWVSQYPPAHVLLLAIGFRLDAVWAVGPVLAAVTVLFTTLAAGRLLPERPATARLAGLLLGVSAFLLCLAGSFMNHITSAAMFAVALYCGVRARDGRMTWALGTGAALAYAFAVRPLSALAVGSVFCLGLWLPELNRRSLGRLLPRLGVAALGASPLLAGLLAYNAYFFGGPFRLGYEVALGPSMGLGFHRDPWGNFYGPLEALAYTASDLLTLGVSLLETPISAVLIVGAYLLVAKRLDTGTRIFAGWALAPVVANTLYWHHGIYMGPRMLLESAPGWVVLTVIAAVELTVRAPEAPFVWTRFSPRAAVASGLAFAGLFGLLVLAPQRARSYGGDWIPIARLEVPRVEGQALVFVHDAWIGRLGMRMAVAGLSLDRVETLVRQNSTCDVQTLADRITSKDPAERAAALRRLDTTPRAHGLPPEIELVKGDKVRMMPGERWTSDCIREARSDARGILDIAPLIWQGDLPGVPGGGPLFVRDLGPEQNARLIESIPERTPWFYYLDSPDADPELIPYPRAMALLWGGEESGP